MRVIYEQEAIRAQLSIVSNPPVSPIDANTGEAPQFFRGAGIEIDVGVFDADNLGLDLSNLTALVLALSPSPTALAPWTTKTLAAEDIRSPIDFGDWQAGTDQNARFILTPADTDLGLLSAGSRQFWMSITGFTASSGTIVYGAGWVTIYNPGNTLPPPYPGYVSNHNYPNAGGNTSIAVTGQVETDTVPLSGSAGTRNFPISTVGVRPGSRLTLLFSLPTTANIVVNVYSGSITGDPVQSFTTTGSALVPDAALDLYFDGTQNAWVALAYQGPIP